MAQDLESSAQAPSDAVEDIAAVAEAPEQAEEELDWLTDEQIACEEELMRGVPRLNIGALFMPGIWGPVHGLWASIIFYPLWLFADNTFYSAYAAPSAMSITFAIIVFVLLTAVTIAYAILGQPIAAKRAAAKGKTKEQFLKEQRIWAVICVIIGIVFLAVATYYNLQIRPFLPTE